MKKISVFVLLGCLCISLVAIKPIFAQSPDDLTEDEQANVEDEKEEEDALSKSGPDVDDEDSVMELKPSPDAEVYMLFTKPAKSKDLPAGSLIKFLVSFYNKGEKDFLVKEVDASFRYPGDFNFFIQNYTAAKFDRVVEAGHESTFDYAFSASEQYAGRPLGLIVQLRYVDASGKAYQNAVFNETINIVEDESTFNPETGFLYMVFACLVVLVMLLGQQMLSKMRKRHGMSSSTKSKPQHVQQPMETGTKDTAGIDFEWIPRQVQNIANKSPGRSPQSSARHQRTKKDE